MTPLKGIDGQVYAVAQGNLVVGGFDAEAATARITVNVPSAGRIPASATVSARCRAASTRATALTLNLNRPDFTTAKRIVDRINELLGPGVALGGRRLGAGQRAARRPAGRPVDPGEPRRAAGRGGGQVIINSRTGTIVIGQNVKVSPAAVTTAA